MRSSDAPQQDRSRFVVKDQRNTGNVPAAPGDEAGELFEQTVALLRSRMAPNALHDWIEPLRPEALEADELRVSTPEPCRWVEERFSQVMRVAASEAAGRKITVAFIPRSEPPEPLASQRIHASDPRLRVRRVYAL
jgi:hypothetical protein